MIKNFKILLVQDLTWVNGEVLALYTSGPQNYYIERWVDREDGWDRFLLAHANFTPLLNFLDGKISLHELFVQPSLERYLRTVKGELDARYVIFPGALHSRILPKQSSYLKLSSDFIDDDRYYKVRNLQPGPHPSLMDSTLCFYPNIKPQYITLPRLHR